MMDGLKVPLVFTTAFSSAGFHLCKSHRYFNAKSAAFLDRVLERYDNNLNSREQYRLMVLEAHLMDNHQLRREFEKAIELRDRLAVDAKNEKKALSCSHMEKIHKLVGCSLTEIPSFYKLMLINQAIFVLQREMIERNVKVESCPPLRDDDQENSSIVRWLRLIACCWSANELCVPCKLFS